MIVVHCIGGPITISISAYGSFSFKSSLARSNNVKRSKHHRGCQWRSRSRLTTCILNRVVADARFGGIVETTSPEFSPHSKSHGMARNLQP